LGAVAKDDRDQRWKKRKEEAGTTIVLIFEIRRASTATDEIGFFRAARNLRTLVSS